MARVLSVSVPETLYEKWKESDLDISPSSLFQSALESELTKTNQFLKLWSERALKAEKKLKIISDLLNAKDGDVKKFLVFADTEGIVKDLPVARIGGIAR